jgi:dihydrofolate reductase
MGHLIYLVQASLDGFIGDGDFTWSAPDPDEEVLLSIIGDLAGVGTQIYGRRTYETMAVWETEPGLAEQSPNRRTFATTWQDTDKIVVSTTLEQPFTRRTRVERTLDAGLVGGIEGDVTVGGPTLAAEALRQDLVDAVVVYWHPVLLGGGIPVLAAGVRRDLRLNDETRFANGVIKARYDVIR